MPLAPLAEPTGIDLLLLLDGYLDAFKEARLFIQENREKEGIPQDAPFRPDEIDWLEQLDFYGQKALLLKQALEELPPDDIIDLWIKKTNQESKRGRPHETEFIYTMAWLHLDLTKQSTTEIYNDMVRPYLIYKGLITIDKNGNPDPEQDKQALRNFQNAMSRRKKLNPRKSS